MRNIPLILIIMVAVASSQLFALEVQDGGEKNSCIICHSDIEEAFKDSVHHEFKVTCTSCHGGDPTKVEWEDAMSPEAGFKGEFTAEEKLDLCSSCHSDDEKMRQFGIPIDQFQRYKSSQHGKSLFDDGNQDVAVCTSCHGTHDIMKAKDSRSHVYPLNIPDTCAKCHANKDLMQKYGIRTDVVDEYTKGSHGHGLLGEKNTGFPNCATCHGSHGAAPPGVAEVVNVCGQCHANTKKHFQESKHFLVMDMECIDCHDNHNNVHPTKAMYSDPDNGCLKCHDKDSEEYTFIKQQIILKLENAEISIDMAEKSIEEASHAGLYVASEESLLKEAKSSLTKFAPMQHSVSDEEMKNVLDDAISVSSNIEDDLEILRQGLVTRQVIAFAIAFFFLFFCFVFFLKWRQLMKAYLRSKNK